MNNRNKTILEVFFVMVTGTLMAAVLMIADLVRPAAPISAYERVEQLRADLKAAEMELQYEQMNDDERLRGVVYETE